MTQRSSRRSTTYAEMADGVLPGRRAGDRVHRRDLRPGRPSALFQNQGAFISLITPAECDESLVPGEDFTLLQDAVVHGRRSRCLRPSVVTCSRRRRKRQRGDQMACCQYLGSAEAQQIWAGARRLHRTKRQRRPSTSTRRRTTRPPRRCGHATRRRAAGYDLDDWIGGEIQSTLRRCAASSWSATVDVEAFIATMTEVDTGRAADRPPAIRAG